MDLDVEYQYMRDSGLPALMEGILSRLVEERPDDPLAAIAHHALPVRAQSFADKMADMWPAQEPASEAERRSLATFDFDVFQYAGDDPNADRLLVFAEAIFDMSGALTTLGCPRDKFRLWLLVLREQYNPDVPFHNFRHAFAVLQQGFVFLRTISGLVDRLEPLEIAAFLFSCLSHDMGHPGLNNTYQINAQTPLAVRYNDQAVLENWHGCLAFETVRCADCDLLCSLKPERRKQFRSVCVALILATEVAKHKSFYTRLKEIIENRTDEGKGQWTGLDLINWDDAQHRLVVLQNLMMMSDVSNETRAFKFSQRWGPLVCEEFCRQGDLEKEERLPVIPMMDRDRCVVAKEQPGFIKYLCLPLYETNARIFPELQCCVDHLKENVGLWEQKQKQDEADEGS